MYLVGRDIISEWYSSGKPNVSLLVAHQELLSFLVRAGHTAGLWKGLVCVCGIRRKSERPQLLCPTPLTNPLVLGNFIKE